MTNAFLHMIRMFYDRHAFEVFMARSPFLGLPRAVVNLVGGNTGDLPGQLVFALQRGFGGVNANFVKFHNRSGS